jgi:hypothetical protein
MFCRRYRDKSVGGLPHFALISARILGKGSLKHL